MTDAQRAFSDMIDSYLPYIRSICGSYPSRHRQDLMQEGLIGLYLAYKRFDSVRGEFEPFAKRCIRNRIISAYRVLGRTDSDTIIEQEPEDSDTADLSERAEIQEFFEQFRATLSVLERTVFDLYLQDVSYDEISSRLGISKKSISDAMLRVKRKIKEKYSL